MVDGTPPSDRIAAAYLAAREARFEHGERPGKVKTKASVPLDTTASLNDALVASFEGRPDLDPATLVAGDVVWSLVLGRGAIVSVNHALGDARIRFDATGAVKLIDVYAAKLKLIGR